MDIAELGSALDLLAPGESALCILTGGIFLEIKADGSGSSGWWVISPYRKYERVIIYKSSDGNAKADLYLARPDGVEGPRVGEGDTRDRYLVKFLDAKQAGSTGIPWKEFASAGQNPIRYISKKLEGHRSM